MITIANLLGRSKAFNKSQACSLCLMRASVALIKPYCFHNIIKHNKSISSMYVRPSSLCQITDSSQSSLASCASLTSGMGLDSINC